jgi:predicted phage terminase large subunit-like protein
VCDSKNLGVDYVASPVGYVYGDLVYIDDVVYDNSLPEITRPRVSDMWFRNNVVRADVEMNNGGNYYAEDLNKLIKAKGGKTSVRMFFSSNNKTVKIITYADYVKKHFVFRDPSTYSKNSDYAKYMKALLSWTQMGNNKHDDGPDVTAMLAQLVQELQCSTIKIIDRRQLG